MNETKRPGRPAIDASGERMKRITVTISSGDAAELLRIGDGNISAGVRYLVQGHRRLLADVRCAALAAQP